MCHTHTHIHTQCTTHIKDEQCLDGGGPTQRTLHIHTRTHWHDTQTNPNPNQTTLRTLQMQQSGVKVALYSSPCSSGASLLHCDTTCSTCSHCRNLQNLQQNSTYVLKYIALVKFKPLPAESFDRVSYTSRPNLFISPPD